MDKNLDLSFFWYELSAEKGNAEAQFNLGRFYENGIHVEQNLEKAFFWYRRSAVQSNAEAQFSLGRFYEKQKT